MSWPTKSDYERARAAVMDEAAQINARWRAQPRVWRRISDDQWDVEREAEQQGISVRKYLGGW